MSCHVKLSVSLIRANILNLEKVFRELSLSDIDLIHIDIMDGRFAPTLGFPLDLIRLVKDITCIPLDIHLLVEEPVRFSPMIALEPTDQVSFHIEAVEFHRLQETIDAFRRIGSRIGLGSKVETPLNLFIPWLKQVDIALILTIPPGGYGVPPNPVAFKRIQELATVRRSRFPNIVIQVDGGVNAQTVRTFVRAGADILVCGSILFNEQGIQASVSALRGLFEGME